MRLCTALVGKSFAGARRHRKADVAHHRILIGAPEAPDRSSRRAANPVDPLRLAPVCGIAGFAPHVGAVLSPSALERMLDAVRPRGPDDEGICVISRQDGVAVHCRTARTLPVLAARLPTVATALLPGHDLALVNTRYAILDVGPGSHQPFASRDGSVVAVVNGEIYNYREVAAELRRTGMNLRTTGDTEVLVEGYRMWGDAVWARLNGFWSVALYDRRDATLTLSRDRLGVAPLYYLERADGLYFASNIRALIGVAPDDVELDLAVLRGFIDTELKDFDGSTCFRGIRSFPAATRVRLALGQSVEDGDRLCFWRPPVAALAERDLPFGEAVSRYREILLDAVALRLHADVPVACELSGGLDSSSIVAAAAAQRPGITTYTVRVAGQDEEPFARALRKRYRLDYRVLDATDEQLFDHAPSFAAVMEEPYHAPNVYAHHVMRRRMKQDGVAVALAGSGGDEVLAGYEWDFWPQALRDLLARRRVWHAARCHVAMRLGTPRRAAATITSFGNSLRSYLRSGSSPRGLENRSAADTPAARLQGMYPRLPFHAQRLFHLTVGLLPYYLRSDDHLTMAIPLEHRLPFLDYRLVELALLMPAEYLFRDGWTKYVHRKAVEPLLPSEVVWRREKMGFPFALRPFLARHAVRLAPLVQEVRDVGILNAARGETEFLEDPLRFWRICSTGLWLRELPGWGVQAPFASTTRRAT